LAASEASAALLTRSASFLRLSGFMSNLIVELEFGERRSDEIEFIPLPEK
jgi:hypothetical protein